MSGLNADEVAGELTKMVEFIKKEAQEKAKEIRIKAEEEYEIEKANVVRSETAQIDKDYENKYKQARMAQQTVKSTVANKARLNLLQAKEEVVDAITQDTQERLEKLVKNKNEYQALLEKLIAQGIDLLREKNVQLRVREADLDVATKAAEAASKDDTTVEIADERLPDSVSGGVVVTTLDGRIRVDNTLDKRLKTVIYKALPYIRQELFGESKTRKFKD